MGLPHTSAWRHVGRTSNAEYFVIEEGVLGVMPDRGSADTAPTARENIAFQNRHFREHGPGVSLVFIELSSSIDKGARQVYRDEADGEVVLGAAMIGGNMLARAIGSFFLGLARPRVPFRLVATYPEGLTWARELLARHASRRGPR